MYMYIAPHCTGSQNTESVVLELFTLFCTINLDLVLHIGKVVSNSLAMSRVLIIVLYNDVQNSVM